MTDPELDHEFLEGEDDFLNYDSPFFDFGFNDNELVQEYFNKIECTLAYDMDTILGLTIGKIDFILRHLCIRTLQLL